MQEGKGHCLKEMDPYTNNSIIVSPQYWIVELSCILILCELWDHLKVQHRLWNLLSKTALISNVMTVLGSADTRLKPLREILSLRIVKKKCFISLARECANNNVSFSLQSARENRAKSEEVLLRKLTSFLAQFCLPVFLFSSTPSLCQIAICDGCLVFIFYLSFCIPFNCLNTLFLGNKAGGKIQTTENDDGPYYQEERATKVLWDHSGESIWLRLWGWEQVRPHD